MKYKILLIALLVLLFDRVEYLWYGVSSERQIVLLSKFKEAKVKKNLEYEQVAIWNRFLETEDGKKYSELDTKIQALGPVSFRADSFIYYASQRVQYIIFAYILTLLIQQLKRPLMWFSFCEVLYFVEYFVTYNEPIYKVPMIGDWYAPISVATLKFISIAYLIVEAVMLVDQENQD